MEKKHYIIYIIILASLYIILPTVIFILNRIFELTRCELMGLIFPTSCILFFGTVAAGMLSENLK